jgi:hypothetical protein
MLFISNLKIQNINEIIYLFWKKEELKIILAIFNPILGQKHI